jgi:hypothetical protein
MVENLTEVFPLIVLVVLVALWGVVLVLLHVTRRDVQRTLKLSERRMEYLRDEQQRLALLHEQHESLMEALEAQAPMPRERSATRQQPEEPEEIAARLRAPSQEKEANGKRDGMIENLQTLQSVLEGPGPNPPHRGRMIDPTDPEMAERYGLTRSQ